MSTVVSFQEYLLQHQNHDEASQDALSPPTEFDWLLSDYNDNSWEVRDPFSSESPGTVKLHFDGPMISGGRLSDHPTYIHDAKLALAMAVEIRSLQGVRSVSSKSKIRHFLSSYKRMFNERLHMGFDSWKGWKLKDSVELIKRLPYKASVTQGYLNVFKQHVNTVGCASLPVIENAKTGLHKLDVTGIFAGLGLDYNWIVNDTEIKVYINELTNSLASTHPEKRLQRANLPKKKSEKVNKKQYEDYLSCLEMLGALCGMVPDLFLDPWPASIVDDTKDMLPPVDFEMGARGRTRNIPVDLFLKIMDVACRYVLDYAEPLFEAEATLKQEHAKLEKTGATDTGKLTNAFARELGVLVDGPFSPFPLAAYKHQMMREQTIPQDEYDRLEQLLADGVASRDIMEQLCLTEGQFYGRVRTLRDPYNRKLPHSGLSLQKALYQFLPLSCLMILFAFSARREHEVFGLTTKSYKRDGDCWRVKFFVGKTDRKDDWFVHTSLVGKALKILERLSEEGRMESGSDSLFRFNDTYERAPLNMDRLTTAIENFQEFIGVDCDKNGERFKFSEHQFRRFFAILYFYRYEKGADAEALMHELRHADWSMTKVYLTERETGRIFREVEKDYIARKGAMSIDDDSISGPMAMEFKEKLKGNGGINVVPEKRRKMALKVVEEGQLSIEFVSEGLCFGHSPGRKQLSNCVSDGFVMCHRSSPEMCKECPNLLSVDDIKNRIPVQEIPDDEYGESIILNAALGI